MLPILHWPRTVTSLQTAKPSKSVCQGHSTFVAMVIAFDGAKTPHETATREILWLEDACQGEHCVNVIHGASYVINTVLTNIKFQRMSRQNAAKNLPRRHTLYYRMLGQLVVILAVIAVIVLTNGLTQWILSLNHKRIYHDGLTQR